MYGQLPVNVNPMDPKSQHPIPGSYNRHAFNPSTKSFVPGNGMTQIQPPQPPFANPGSHHGSPLVGSPHLAYAAYQPAVPPPQPYGGNAGYGMARQGSNNSMPSYMAPQPHVPLPAPQIPMQHMQHPPQHLPQNPPPHLPSKPVIPQGLPPMGGGPPNYSHLPNHGNPATLPQKPTTTGV
jgi:hypothetical protein